MDKKCESSSSIDEPCEEIDVNFSRSKKGKRKYTRESLADRQVVEKQKNNRKKTKRNINSKVGGKTFNYTGRKREKKEKCSNNKIGNVNCHEMVSATTSQIHQQLTDTSPLFEELDEVHQKLIENLKEDFRAASRNQFVRKTWQERQCDQRKEWENVRTDIFESYVSKQPFRNTCCNVCQKVLELAAVRCMTCKNHLCWDCDDVLHCRQPFHHRYLVNKEILQPLKPCEFWDKDWKSVLKDICVPCFVPTQCVKCSGKGNMKLIPNPDPNLQIAVVMHQGRFDLRAASFLCKDCREITDADKNDYIFSGFWPARATTSISYLFCEELFAMWYHLRHKSPLNSEKMFINTIEEISKESGRSPIVNDPLFSRAFKEWELCRLNIKVKIKNMSTVSCPPCGKSPVMGSSDGNVKLKRHASAGKVLNPQNERESIQEEALRFGDLVIKSDKDVANFRNRIYTKIKKTQKKEMCGGSAFKAAKVDSCKRSKSDETGLLLSVCRHGIGLGAINMHEGESMTYTLFLQKLVFGLNCKFFCNDVICRYEKFVRKVAIAFPEYQQMTSKMKGILPRMHAKAHHWPCQILYNPHWQKGAGLTVGEEHEQVFSKLSLYGYVTKHMSKANRMDLLSAAILYWNWGKIERMPSILSKRLKRASKCVAVYNEKLTSLLNSNQCNIEDLPEILKELKTKALANLGSRQNRKTPFNKLKRNLEGLFIQMKNVSIFISTQAESCKTRTKFRGVLTKLKGKAVKLLSLINSKYRAIHGIISMDDFEKGIFPWDVNSEDDSENESSTLSLSQKYELVDTWMLLQRAEEEITLCKMEMKEYILYLDSTRSSLNRNLIDQNVSCEETNEFIAGKAILMRCEIARLDVKIQESLETFQLYSEADFIRLTQFEAIEVHSAGEVESDLESYTSEEPHDFESSLTEDSDELDEDTEEESQESFEFTDSDQN